MSPEQALGEDVDARTDLWALGVMLYEMLTGKLPFPGSSATAILFEVVHHEPKRPRESRADVDPELERIALKALAKKREDRYASAAEIVRDLTAFQIGLTAPTLTTINPVTKPAARRKSIAISAGLAVVRASGAFFRIISSRLERRSVAADVARLIRDGDLASAFIRAKAAGNAIAEDQWTAMSSVVTIETTPPGAEIRWKNYSTPEAGWQSLGRSPLANVRIPFGVLRVQVSKDGFETFDGVLVKWNGDLHDPAAEPSLRKSDPV
jgi:serine/threonine protein kinase